MDTFVIYILFYHNKNFHTHTKQKRVEGKTMAYEPVERK